MKAEEVIVSSAIKRGNLIIPGHRHADCFQILSTIIEWKDRNSLPVQQGFLNGKLEFLTREEAYKVVAAGNQIIKCTDIQENRDQRTRDLYSEDLW